MSDWLKPNEINLENLDHPKPADIDDLLASLRGGLETKDKISQLGQAELAQLYKLYQAYEAREEYGGGAAKWFVPGTPFSIERCPKHQIFFSAGDAYRERVFLASNRTGKSISGALETSFHATGIYPDWWQGRRFDHPVKIWACGKTGQTTRDTVQKELIGAVGAFGKGMIPKESILQTWARPGIPQAIDTATIRHVSGGTSVIGFKSYDQDINAFMGTAMDVVWMDEECPELIYNEALIRTMTTNGIIYVTFTPIAGVTPFITGFAENCDYLAGSLALFAVDETKQTEVKHRAIINAGWDDAPWLDEQAKKDILASTPIHLRDARSKGIPTLGSGTIYPYSIENILIDDREIPAHYRRMYALDVGWNRTAALWMAKNPDTGEMWIYSEHYVGHTEPYQHALAVRARGEWIPGVIDPASHGASQVDGQKLINIYRRDHKLKVIEAKNQVEAGIYAVSEALAGGKLKFFRSLINLQKEFLVYRRDDKGKIIKQNDHLMDALRYLVLNQHVAQPTPLSNLVGGPQHGSGRQYFTNYTNRH